MCSSDLSGACGHRQPTRILARDGTLQIAPIDADQALAQLGELVRFHQKALIAPLPVAPKTALAFLAAKSDPEADAAFAYEGDPHTRGEVTDPTLARCFPDFEALSEGGQFEHFARTVYGALAHWVTTSVTGQRHASTADDLSAETAGDAA